MVDYVGNNISILVFPLSPKIEDHLLLSSLFRFPTSLPCLSLPPLPSPFKIRSFRTPTRSCFRIAITAFVSLLIGITGLVSPPSELRRAQSMRLAYCRRRRIIL